MDVIVCTNLSCPHTPCPPARCPSPSALLRAEPGGAVLPRGASARPGPPAALRRTPPVWDGHGLLPVGFDGLVQLDTSWARPARRRVADPASTGWMYRNGRSSAAPHPPQRAPRPPPPPPKKPANNQSSSSVHRTLLTQRSPRAQRLHHARPRASPSDWLLQRRK